MKNRTALQAADLYVLLQREFRRRQSPQCGGCYVQLPYRVDRPDEEAPNWEVRLPPACSFGCRQLAEELIEEFRMLYDLQTDPGHH
jgi:hypothetical protein